MERTSVSRWTEPEESKEGKRALAGQLKIFFHTRTYVKNGNERESDGESTRTLTPPYLSLSRSLCPSFR